MPIAVTRRQDPAGATDKVRLTVEPLVIGTTDKEKPTLAESS